MSHRTTCSTRKTCSAKCIIRADCSPVGGLKGQLSTMQTKAFQVSRGDTKVAQMSFASQVPLAEEKGDNLFADRFSSKQISEEP